VRLFQTEFYTGKDSKLRFGRKQKLSKFDDHKWLYIRNIRTFMIGELRCFGADENSISNLFRYIFSLFEKTTEKPKSPNIVNLFSFRKKNSIR